MKMFSVDKFRLYFSLRATVASLIALAVGFLLKLESPHWTAITVWVVTQPSRGMTLSKAFYRFFGTAIGALFAVFLIHFFALQPGIFILLLALWVGLATGVANVVQYFRSYGAMLSGFTAALVGLSVFSHPDQVVEVAGSRVFGIFIGIAVALLMASVLIPSTSKQDLFRALDQVVTQILEWTSDVFLRKPRSQLIEGERALVARISQIEELTSYAANESMQIRKQKRHLHNLLASLFATISAVRAVGLHWRRNPDLVTATQSMRESTSDALQILAPYPDAKHLLEFSDRFRGLTWPNEAKIEYKVMIDRLQNFNKSIANMFDQYLAVGRKSLIGSPRTLSFHRDVRHAKTVAIRSTLAVLSVGTLWLSTGWELGPVMVIITAVHCGIFATSNNPKSGIWTAFRASLLAIICAFVCAQLLALGPQSLWFEFLLMSAFLIPGGVFVTHPTRSLAGTLFCANFIMFLAPTYPVQPFDLKTFAGLGTAYFASTLITFTFFYFVLPTDPSRRSRNVIRDIVRDLERMARATSDYRAFEWETLMYNRVSNVVKILAETGEVKQGVLEGCFSALDIGQEILNMHGAVGASKEVTPKTEIIMSALQSMSEVSKDPRLTSRRLKVLAEMASHTWPELYHSLNDIAELLNTHNEFFILTARR